MYRYNTSRACPYIYTIVLTTARLAFESQIRVHSDAVSLWTLEYVMNRPPLNGGGVVTCYRPFRLINERASGMTAPCMPRLT
jgi:hypothetical protein